MPELKICPNFKDLPMQTISVVFPHQLLRQNPALHPQRPVYLVEELLFFNQYRFHKHKIAFSRATMTFYLNYLQEHGFRVTYIDAQNELSDVRKLLPFLAKKGAGEIHYIDPTDDRLSKRLQRSAAGHSLPLKKYQSPMFLNTTDELLPYFHNNANLNQTRFYIDQRKQRKILIDKDNSPVGGKWTFDVENRHKYPKDKTAPAFEFPDLNPYYQRAADYTHRYFRANPGSLDLSFRYPATFAESSRWLNQFLRQRFAEFGPYEDAIVGDEILLHHSLLSPLLNSGLLTPAFVVKKALEFGAENNIPFNSLEGFIRQVAGWREFIRGVYLFRGVQQRTKNFWGFRAKIPKFYNATTGIVPVDTTIRKVLETGYCHHIERLMILGNFMLLCEFGPNQVYRWFMEMFVDAYDWVMVPNVYGMSQFADGGLMATKPYISGSNYIFKMSDYKKAPWQKTWDALFWRFMHVHRDFFLKNPRLVMLVKTFDKMSAEKQADLLQKADHELEKIRSL